MPENTFDESEIERLERMARLHVPAGRRPELQRRLQAILGAFQALRSLPTDAAPGNDPTPLPLREDQPATGLDNDQVLANAPQKAAGCFLVPRVIEG